MPTLDESGLHGFDVSQWWGMLAPAGTPRDVVVRLNAELMEIVELAKMQTSFAELGAEPIGNSPERFGEFLGAEIAKYRKVVREAKIKID